MNLQDIKWPETQLQLGFAAKCIKECEYIISISLSKKNET